MNIELRNAGRTILLNDKDFPKFCSDLIALHTFDRVHWEHFPREHRDISAALGGIPDTLKGLSPQRQLDVASHLNRQFAQGRLLWPIGEAASSIQLLKKHNPEAALLELISTMERVKRGQEDAVSTNRIGRSEEIANRYQPQLSVAQDDLAIFQLQQDEKLASILRELEIARKQQDERFAKDRNELEVSRSIEMERFSSERERLIALFRELEKSLLDRETVRMSEFEKLRLESQQSFEIRATQADTAIGRINDLSESLNSKLDSWTKEKTSELTGWRDAFQTSFATEAAHTYWANTKFKRHAAIAQKLFLAGIGLFIFVLGSAGTMVWLGRGHKQAIWETPMAIALPLGVSIVAFVWLGRLLARTYMAHVQLAEDAQERATMIETYVALIRADVLDKSKAEDAQKALFRPASSGLLAGDGGPDTPIEVITKAISGNKS